MLRVPVVGSDRQHVCVCEDILLVLVVGSDRQHVSLKVSDSATLCGWLQGECSVCVSVCVCERIHF